MKDFYYLLGTDNKATPQEINSAYRKLAQKFDQDGKEYDHFIEDHFREITEAYQLLSNPVRRRKYDIALKKHQQRRFYWWFRIKHLNVATSLALVLFTGLFGWYVVHSLRGSKKATTITVPVVTAVKVKHHKKRKVLPVKALAETPYIAKTVIKPTSVKKDTPNVYQAKPAATIAKQAPLIVKQPAIIKQPPAEQKDESYTATIQANMTGVVNLHQQSGYNSTVVASIPNHTQVKVLEKGSNFYKISYNGQTGYVPKWTIPAP